MCSITTLFMPYDWPLTLWHWWSGFFVRSAPPTKPEAKKAPPPRRTKHKAVTAAAATNSTQSASLWPVLLIAAFLTVNVAMPIRYVMYPGDVAWHEHGHRFSWRMKLRDKICHGGFIVQDPSDNSTQRGDLSPLMARHRDKMWARPEMIVHYAHYLADLAVRNGAAQRPRVYADATCSLNFRPPQLFVDPEFDLASWDKWAWPYPFMTELDPLRPEQLDQLLWRRLWHSPRSLLEPVRDD